MEGKTTLRLFPVQSFDCAQDKRTGAALGLEPVERLAEGSGAFHHVA